MKNLVMIITLAMVMTVLIPVVALAYDTIIVTGNWEVEYEVIDSGVSSDGGTGTLRLKIKNTSPSDIIHYVSISFATGTDSEFYENRRVTIGPTRDRIMDFSIPIAAADAGHDMQLWVAMSTRGESNVDGIGVQNGLVFGPPARYDMVFEISTGTTTINQGESVRINFGGSNGGNKPLDVKVYDQTGAQIFETDNMDVLFIGHKDYAPSSTTTYRFRAEAYRVGTDRLEKEVLSSSITITVIEPTPEPTATSSPEPTEAPTPEPTPEPTPIPTIVPTSELEAEETPDIIEEELPMETLVVEPTSSEEPAIIGAGNGGINSGSGGNNLWTVIIATLVLVAALLIVVIIFLLKGKKSDNFA